LAAIGVSAAAILVLVLLLPLAATSRCIKGKRSGRYKDQGRRNSGEPGRVFFHVSQRGVVRRERVSPYTRFSPDETNVTERLCKKL
jgi:hypothetical protein